MLPYFYQADISEADTTFTLDEPTSKHCVQVLRMKEGEEMLLTNGKGLKLRVTITMAERKRCSVVVTSIENILERPVKMALGIAFTKNNSRNEWLLEKATEMGIEEIFPLQTQRGEKEKLKTERLNNILVSAMLQSQQCFLPILHELTTIQELLHNSNYDQCFVAHCLADDNKMSYFHSLKKDKNTLVLIGPEGDFSQTEIALCLENKCIPVSFGENRLRTETAGLYACTVFNAINYG